MAQATIPMAQQAAAAVDKDKVKIWKKLPSFKGNLKDKMFILARYKTIDRILVRGEDNFLLVNTQPRETME